MISDIKAKHIAMYSKDFASDIYLITESQIILAYDDIAAAFKAAEHNEIICYANFNSVTFRRVKKR